MFRDDHQSARACRALLARIGLVDLWTHTGPTPKAILLLDQDGGPLSSGERILLLAAFALWNGEGFLLLVDVIEGLDVEHADALCSLLIARKYGAEAVDTWLATHERSSLRPVGSSS